MCDKSWMSANRISTEYVDGVENFIRFALDHGVDPLRFSCPCIKCRNLRTHEVGVVRDHLVCNGIRTEYKQWIWHGEKSTSSYANNDTTQFSAGDTSDSEGDRLDEMMDDVQQLLIDRPDMFENFVNDAQKPLYEGCTKFTRLSAVLKLYNLKAGNTWSDKSFSALLQLMKEMLPAGNCLPENTYESKKLLRSVGMEYEKIHACPNDCILYRKNYSSLQSCPNPDCGEPRYVNGSPRKVVWYFPIRPRFRRLFGNPNDAKNLTWHANGRVKDDKIRHPADSQQWKTIDEIDPKFGSKDRNLRLALSTDGMNPHGNMSSSHSTWPVILVTYNLPSSLCMKRKYMFLSLLISGPKQPGNDIDVYLAPLIEDLKDLWEKGFEVYDAYRKELFCLRAVLFCTISDWPALGNLSGYSVKGYHACIHCGSKTHSIYLPCSKKVAYLGGRRFLDSNHRYRRLKKAFDENTTDEVAPEPLSGDQILAIMKSMNWKFGKKSKNDKSEGYKKESKLFILPYWKDLSIRHCLDVMHIEKNIFESFIGTLLNVSGKTKDGINARNDYRVLNIRPELVQDTTRAKRTYLPPACYTLSRVEKEVVCKFFADIKVPDGYSSNINNLVSMKDLKLIGLKSHDCHVLMQQLLPVAIRSILPRNVRNDVINLCFFFKKLCSKAISRDELADLQNEIVVILCQLEMYFPPSFFDIMVHLTVHLVREVELCGPVYLRWMYPFERYMKILKGYVMNRNRPEGCIVERYIVEEAVDFCTDYLSNVEPIGLSKSRHSGDWSWKGTSGYKVISIDRKEWTQAHMYVLHNLEEVQPYVDEHMEYVRTHNRRFASNDNWITKEHNRTFVDWFRDRVFELLRSGEEVSGNLKLLSKGPKFQVMSFTGFVINNTTFCTKEKDDKGTRQNSGVTLVAQAMHVSSSKDKNHIVASMSYYGVIQKIWVLLYSSELKIHVFGCDWVDCNSGVQLDEMGFITVALDKLGHKEEPFILASQAKQVFYVPDLRDSCRFVVLFKPNRLIDEEVDDFSEESINSLCQNHADHNTRMKMIDMVSLIFV